MALPKFYPFRPPELMSALCTKSCEFSNYQEIACQGACKNFPAFYTQGKEGGPKILLILDTVTQEMMGKFAKGLKENWENEIEASLWGDGPHLVLRSVLSTLINEDANLFLTHALKCGAPSQFTSNLRKHIFTPGKEVQAKAATQEIYEQEKSYFAYCMQHALKEIELYNPDVIVTFGHRVSNFFFPDQKEIYKSRGKNVEMDICGRKRLVVSTIGCREVLINNHLASQWKVDIARAMWLATELGKEYQHIPTNEEMIQINNPEDFRQIIGYLRQTGLPFAWDTETTGLKKIENEVLMLSLCFDGVHGYTIPVRAARFISGYDEELAESLVKELLDLPNEKICFNAKFDMEAIGHVGPRTWLPVNNKWDLAFQAYTFEENFGDALWRDEKQPGLTNVEFGWLSLAGQVTDMLGIRDEQWLGEKDDRKDMVAAILKKGWDGVARYAAKDAIYTFRGWGAYFYLMPFAMKESLEKVAGFLLHRAQVAITQVEKNGLPIENETLALMMDKNVEGTVAYELEQAKQAFLRHPNVQKYSAHAAAENAKTTPVVPKRANLFGVPKGLVLATPEPFNLDSPKQMISFFFDYLGLEPAGKKRSCDKEFLAKYGDQREEVAFLKEYRERFKLLNTFLAGFSTNAGQYSDGRVRASYGLDTITGRTTCKEPNLQQIPRSGEGNSVKGLLKKVIKARPGYALVAADYATAEVRVLALVAHDQVLADVFKKVDSYKIEFLKNPSKEMAYKMKTESDFHKINASNMLGLKLDEVTKVQRNAAKKLTFLVCYAQNPAPNLANQLNVPIQEAQGLVNGFLGAYKGVNKWFKDNEAFALENGYVKSLFGRRRALYGLYGSDYEVSHAWNMARNAPVQGTASDWTLMAAYEFQELVRPTGDDVRIVNLVHDAIYVECPIELLPKWTPILLRTMEKPESVKAMLSEEDFNFVPMAADCEISLDQYDTVAWDDTDEHMGRIQDWLKAGAPKGEKPYSLYVEP